MLSIDYNYLLNDDFVFNLTNNILKTQNDSNKSITKIDDKFYLLENDKILNLDDDIIIKKILNSIYLFKKTKEDPFIIFKMKDEGYLNNQDFDSELYNTISVSILSYENKYLYQELNKNFNSNNKKRKLDY